MAVGYVKVGPKSPQSATSASAGSGKTWANATEILTQDSTNASSTSISNGTVTDFIIAYNFDLSSIPDNATVSGIEVVIYSSASVNSRLKDVTVKLVQNADTTPAVIDSANQTNKADTVNFWTTTNTAKTYGGSADKWGITTLTTALVKSAGFGVELNAGNQTGAGTPTARVDYMSVAVYYQPFVRDNTTVTDARSITTKGGYGQKNSAYNQGTAGGSSSTGYDRRAILSGTGKLSFILINPVTGEATTVARSYTAITGSASSICRYGSTACFSYYDTNGIWQASLARNTLTGAAGAPEALSNVSLSFAPSALWFDGRFMWCVTNSPTGNIKKIDPFSGTTITSVTLTGVTGAINGIMSSAGRIYILEGVDTTSQYLKQFNSNYELIKVVNLAPYGNSNADFILWNGRNMYVQNNATMQYDMVAV
jgi:hypothetical protein